MAWTFSGSLECPQCGVHADPGGCRSGTCRSCSLRWWLEISDLSRAWEIGIEIVWDDPALSMTEAEKTLMRELTD